MKSTVTTCLLSLVLCAFLFSPMAFAKKRKACKKGQKAKVMWKGYLYQATVKKKKGKKYCVHYDGWSKSWDECVKPKRLRCKGKVKTVFKKGQKVEVKWKKKYYTASIMSLRRGKYCISYKGFDKKWDECVKASRVRQLPRKRTASGTGSSSNGSSSSSSSGSSSSSNPLDTLMAKRRLTVSQIKQARTLIRALASSKQGGYWEKLQEKVLFANQRDNNLSYEDKNSGGSCNLTSVGMALQYLGIPNPDSSKQYEEAIDAVRRANLNKSCISKYDGGGGNSVLSGWGWLGLANCMDSGFAAGGGLHKTLDFIQIRPKNGPYTVKSKSWWESNVRDKYLRKGFGIVMGVGGHVVRLQAVTSAGIVIDDPWGKETFHSTKKRRTDVKNGRGKSDSSDSSSETAGEDNLIPWSVAGAWSFEYIAVFRNH